MKDKRNLDFEEFVIQMGRMKRWLPTRLFRAMVDKLSGRGKIDSESAKIIRETKSETDKRRR